MPYREIIAVCSEIHTKHINTVCGQNVELLNVKPGGTCSDRWALEELNHKQYNDTSDRVLKMAMTNLWIFA
jgi:hypothetical protein